MAGKLIAYTWKEVTLPTGPVTWKNTYFLETSEAEGTTAYFETLSRFAEAERHIHVPMVRFLRTDVAPCGPTGKIEDKEGFQTVRTEGYGIRSNEGMAGIEDWRYGLMCYRENRSGRAGRSIYRGTFFEGEVKVDNKDGIRVDYSELFIFYHMKFFKENMHDPRMEQFTGRRLPNSDVIGSWAPLFTYAIGPPVKLQTINDAQTRKRQDGHSARVKTEQCAQTAHVAWWQAHDLVAQFDQEIPRELLQPAIDGTGAAVGGFEPVKKYFEDFQAPPYNSTRWERPRADPDREKAVDAVQSWKALKERLADHMRQLHPNPVTNKVERSWVEGLQDIALDCCAWCNVTLRSRFT